MPPGSMVQSWGWYPWKDGSAKKNATGWNMVAALHQKAQDKSDKLLDDVRCRWRLQQERRRRIAARILKSWTSLWPSARRMLKSVISPRKGGALREQVRAWYAFPIGVLTSLKRIDEWGGKARQICHLQLVLLTSRSTSNKNMSKNVKARLLQLFITVTPAARHSQAGTYVGTLEENVHICTIIQSCQITLQMSNSHSIWSSDCGRSKGHASKEDLRKNGASGRIPDHKVPSPCNK